VNRIPLSEINNGKVKLHNFSCDMYVTIWSICTNYLFFTLIILTVTVEKHDSQNARMKRKNILAHKLMKNKQKVSGTTNEIDT